MATVGAAYLVFEMLNQRSPSREVYAGEHFVVKCTTKDGADGSVVANADVTAVTVTLYDKTSKKIINGRNATALGTNDGINYVPLNEEDNVIVPSATGVLPAVNSFQIHVLRVAVTYVSGVSGVDTLIQEYEFPVKYIATPD